MVRMSAAERSEPCPTKESSKSAVYDETWRFR